jgi:hypothetical protein
MANVHPALHVEGAAAQPVLQCVALTQINRQPLVGRNLLGRKVRLFRGDEPWVTPEWAG